MLSINRRSYMAELRNLLSFMNAKDRDRALARYDELFEQAGSESEEALIAAFGSAIRQVLALEKELRLAQKDGRTPFSEPMPFPEGFVPIAAEGASDAILPENGPEPTENGSASFVRAVADILEVSSPAPEEPPEPIGSMDEDFPMENLIPPGEAQLKTGAIVFPEVVYGMPEGADAEPEEEDAPAEEPSEEPAADNVASETQAREETEPEPTEGPSEESAADSASAPEPAPPSGQENPEKESDSEATEPASAAEAEPTAAEIPAETEEVLTAAEPAPAEEPVPAEPTKEKTAPAVRNADKPKPSAARKKSMSPGPGRVFAAILVTFPFIVLWIVSFALFMALGLAVMAVGFAFCVSGIYLVSYVTNGSLGFMPDLLLVAGSALICFALALLFIWMGLWIAVGGFASVIRWTSSVYRKILRKRVPRKGGSQ